MSNLALFDASPAERKRQSVQVRDALKGLRSANPEVRRSSVDALAPLNHPAASIGLFKALADEDVGVRKAAAKHLNTHFDPRLDGESLQRCALTPRKGNTIERTTPYALYAFRHGREEDMRCIALNVLVSLLPKYHWGDHAPLERLVMRAARDPEPILRMTACQHLPRISHPRALNVLHELAHDPEEPVRRSARHYMPILDLQGSYAVPTPSEDQVRNQLPLYPHLRWEWQGGDRRCWRLIENPDVLRKAIAYAQVHPRKLARPGFAEAFLAELRATHDVVKV